MQFLLLCVEISSRAATTTNQSVSILVQSLHAFLPKLFLCPLFWPKRDSDMELDRKGGGWIKKRIPNPISVPSSWNSNLLKTPIYPF